MISWAVLMCVSQHPLSYAMSGITGAKNILQGDKDEALWNGRNFYLKMWWALSCWYQWYVTWGSMALPPPSGVLGSQHSTCNMQYDIKLQFRYTIQWKINHLKHAWYHNLWMPLQDRLSQTWNIGAKINTRSFSCTRHWTVQDQQAMWQHVYKISRQCDNTCSVICFNYQLNARFLYSIIYITLWSSTCFEQ